MTDDLAATRVALASLALRGVGRKTTIDILSATVKEIPRDANDFEALVRETGGWRATRLSADEFVVAYNNASCLLDEATSKGIAVCAYNTRSYPNNLRSIADPPAVLYVKGAANALVTPVAVAIVGTRNPTSYGHEAARKMAQRCAENGVAVVSGLAIGCDTSAHEGALAGRGVTVAVLAHGLDHVYPTSNEELAERIVTNGGALVSEYSLAETARDHHFIERDRLQSAFSQAVLVIETDVVGGTMHTVKFAQEQKRKVICVKHPQQWHTATSTLGNQQLLATKVALPLDVDDDRGVADFVTDLRMRKPMADKDTTKTAGPFLAFPKEALAEYLQPEELHLDLILCLGRRVSKGTDIWTTFVNHSIGFDACKSPKKCSRRADMTGASLLMSAVVKSEFADSEETKGQTFLVLPMIGSRQIQAGLDDPVTQLAKAFQHKDEHNVWLHTTNLLCKQPYEPLHETKGKDARLKAVRNTHSLLDNGKLLNGGGIDVVFLVDDIVTLGATMNDAARAIRETGYGGRIFGVALAKHIPQEPDDPPPIFEWIKTHAPDIEMDLLKFCP
jgi:DNA processing protein